MPDGTLGAEVSGCSFFCCFRIQKLHPAMVVPTAPAEQSPRSLRLVSAANLAGGGQ